jgi:N6-adenosine-specific RNA methylase IME4
MSKIVMLMRTVEIFQPPHPFAGLRRHGYRVVLADPAYRFSSGPNRNPKNHYATMPIAQIAALPVSELAHPDGCRLFLWITFPQLFRFPTLLKAWGFRYCTGRPWAKLKPNEDGLIIYPDSFAKGTGYEVTNSAELQIIAKRGRPQRLPSVKGQGAKLSGLIIAARREHSRKPDCVRDEIARLFEGPRCELFARSHHPAFEAWGDEINKYTTEEETR